MSISDYKDELDQIDLALKENAKRQTKEWRKEFPLRTKIFSIKAKAAAKGVPFDLEEADIVIPEVCPVFGTPFTQYGDTAPQVDRMIPSLGYVKNNIRIISARANRLKSDASLEELEKIIEYVKNG